MLSTRPSYNQTPSQSLHIAPTRITMKLHPIVAPPEYATFVDMQHMAGKVDGLREKTWALYSKQMTLEQSFTSTGDTLSRLRSRVSTCTSASAQLKRANSGIEREVGELRGGMLSLARRADDLNRRLDEIDQLIMLRRKVGAMTGAENASRIANTRASHRWTSLKHTRPLAIACN